MTEKNERSSYYFYLDSHSFTKAYYINNTHFDFTSKVLEPIFIDASQYEMALLEIVWTPPASEFEELELQLPSKELYVMTDIVTRDVQVGQSYLPLLRTVNKPGIFLEPYYMPVSRDYIERIRIYMRNPDGSYPAFKVGGMRCLVKIRRKFSK